jgi:hypothetical protein
MSSKHKAELYNLYKETGRPREKQFRDYTVKELTDLLVEAGVDIDASLAPDIEDEPLPELRLPDPAELPGQRLNTQATDEIIRVDENGRRWIQEEVRKPAYPKPRGRRVLKYLETGTEVKSVQNGEYVETFEVAGVGAGRPAEVKITLPSYQVGIYKDPRFPFKVHCYDGREGFDMSDVETFYGGPELVPEKVKRIYIENVLCYDVRTVVRAIADEHRHLQLTGRLK